MLEAYRLTRKDGAPGIDGVTAAEYEANLEANLSDLLERIKSGRYHAPSLLCAAAQRRLSLVHRGVDRSNCHLRLHPGRFLFLRG